MKKRGKLLHKILRKLQNRQSQRPSETSHSGVASVSGEALQSRLKQRARQWVSRIEHENQWRPTPVVIQQARPLHKSRRLSFQAVESNDRGNQDGSAVAHESDPKDKKQDDPTPVALEWLGRCINRSAAKITGFCRLL